MKYSTPLFLLISLCTFYTHAYAGNSYAEIDTSGPSITCPANASHECYVDVPDAFTTYQAFIMGGGSASDSCGIDASTFAITESETGSCPRTITRVYEIADSCGNVSSCTQTITVEDITPPIITCPVDSTYDCRGDVPPAITDYNEFINGGGIVSDNCGLDETTFTVTETINGSSPLIFERTYSIEDSCGNLSSCVQTITVNDITPPTITCPADETPECYADVPPAFMNFTDFVNGGGSASDNDGLDETSFTVTETNAGTCPRTITRVYEIADSCGNVSSCAQTIFVDDVTPPVISCPMDITVQSHAELPPPSLTLSEFINNGGTATDNCGLDESSYFFVETGSCSDSIERTYSIGDSCGNVATCVQTISVLEIPPTKLTEEACSFFQAPSGKFLFSSGTHFDTLQYSVNCERVIEIDLTLLDSAATHEHLSGCDSILLPNDQMATSSGYYIDTFPKAGECDSFHVVTYEVFRSSYTWIEISICEGDSFDFNGNYISDAGTYEDTLTTSAGCDSVIILELSTLPILSESLSVEICSGTTYNFNGVVLDSSGTYEDTLLSNLSCDSIVTLNLLVTPPLTETLDIQICAGNNFTFNGIPYDSTGNYVDSLSNLAGCDSIVTLNLTVLPPSTGIVDATICTGTTYDFHGVQLDSNGTYRDTVQDVNGCDSIVILHLKVDSLNTGIRVSGPGTLVSLAQDVSYQWVDCNDDHSIIPGATDSIFIPDSSGSYAVIVTRGQCVDTSDCLDVDITPAIHAEWKEFTVYPNPADQQIQFNIDNLPPITSYRIIDVCGQVIRQQKLSGQTIDIHTLPPGLYLLQIKNYVARFIKE